MPSESKKLPGVLMLLLSALGILFSLLIIAGVFFGLQRQPLSGSSSIEQMSIASSGALALFVGLLLIPTLIAAARYLRGKAAPVKHTSLFKAASIAGFAWLGLIAAGILAVRAQADWFLFVPLTLLTVAVPV